MKSPLFGADKNGFYKSKETKEPGDETTDSAEDGTEERSDLDDFMPPPGSGY